MNLRNQKALGAFFSIRHNMINHINIALKTHVHTGYVVPILTYASQFCYVNRSLEKTIEQVQKLATGKIFGGNETYKIKLTKFNQLPVTLYIEMHDVLIEEQDLQIKNSARQRKTLYKRRDTTRTKNARVETAKNPQKLFPSISPADENRQAINENSRQAATEQERIYDSLLAILHRQIQWTILCKYGNCSIYAKINTDCDKPHL